MICCALAPARSTEQSKDGLLPLENTVGVFDADDSVESPTGYVSQDLAQAGQKLVVRLCQIGFRDSANSMRIALVVGMMCRTVGRAWWRCVNARKSLQSHTTMLQCQGLQGCECHVLQIHLHIRDSAGYVWWQSH
jgi:hypothetical protein